jgi:hypothetical protein
MIDIMSRAGPAGWGAPGGRGEGIAAGPHPDIAGCLTGTGLDALDIPAGLVPRVLRDIRARQVRAGSRALSVL